MNIRSWLLKGFPRIVDVVPIDENDGYFGLRDGIGHGMQFFSPW